MNADERELVADNPISTAPVMKRSETSHPGRKGCHTDDFARGVARATGYERHLSYSDVARLE